MLRKWLKKRKHLKLKRLRLEKAELKYVGLLVQFQELELTLGKIEYDERCHRRMLQVFCANAPTGTMLHDESTFSFPPRNVAADAEPFD